LTLGGYEWQFAASAENVREAEPSGAIGILQLNEDDIDGGDAGSAHRSVQLEFEQPGDCAIYPFHG
jgi:hypothetical protein